MNYSAIIYNILQSSSAVTTWVGTKVYPIVAEQSATFPYIQYRKMIKPTNTKGLATKQDIVNIELNVVSKSPDDADTISRAIRDSLDNTRPGIVEGSNVTSIQFIEQGYEMYSPEEDLFIVPSFYELRISTI